MVNKNKYLAGLVGLAIGFGVAFYYTQKINREGSSVASGKPPELRPSGARASKRRWPGSVRTIERARQPKYFLLS